MQENKPKMKKSPSLTYKDFFEHNLSGVFGNIPQLLLLKLDVRLHLFIKQYYILENCDLNECVSLNFLLEKHF